METTKLSSKGQVIIPKPIRTAHHWEPGQEFEVIDVEEGVLLQPKRMFKETTLEDVSAVLVYKGKRKSIKDMAEAIKKGVMEHHNDCG